MNEPAALTPTAETPESSKELPKSEETSTQADQTPASMTSETTTETGSQTKQSDGNLPEKETNVVEPVQPQAIIKHYYRTRYTYNIYHVANEIAPAFVISLIEDDPEKVATKFWNILHANIAQANLQNYKPRLVSIEALN